MKKIIIVSNLNYSCNNKKIIKELNFDIDRKSFFVIIGPNGSGKTTLVRLIAGMEKINIGSIKIMGISIHDYSNKKLSQVISYVPQNIPIHFPFTVYEIVRMGRSPHLSFLGILGERDKKIIIDSMKFTGIDKLFNRKLYQLSGGERQRVFIAKAICQQSKIIVLDEPTSFLDINHQVKIMNLMKKLVLEKNITVIMVSHDINLAAMYSDKLLLLNKGSIVKTGLPSEVLKFKILESTYGCSMFVDKSPFKDVPRVTPVSKSITDVNIFD